MIASAYHLFGDIYQRRQYLRSRQIPRLGKDAISKMSIALGLATNCLPDDLTVSRLHHLRNGLFVVFQTII